MQQRNVTLVDLQELISNSEGTVMLATDLTKLSGYVRGRRLTAIDAVQAHFVRVVTTYWR